jgi:hypothetical protein
MHVDNVTTAREFATRLTISTGVTPNLYNQLDGITTNSTTNTSGDWTYNWRFTGAALAAWLSPATPTSTVLAEIMSGSSWSTGTMTVDISFTTVPAPAGLAIFALGGLARRRRAA